MSHPAVRARRRLHILGINSGTSIDSVDLALVRVDRRGRSVTCAYVTGSERKYPPALRERLLAAAGSQSISFTELTSLDNELGLFIGRTARAFMSRLARRRIRVDSVASHGQTIQHLPGSRAQGGRLSHGTLQIGSLEQIAAQTGVIVTGDFRQADIASGGEGAPITVGAMHRLLSDRKESRLIVNIGGIANYFFFPAGKSLRYVQAADCGPGNLLSDQLAVRQFNRPFDRNGELACAGQVSKRLLTLVLADPVFTGRRTVSTGRESFGAALVERLCKLAGELELSLNDIMATTAQLTVEAIAASVLKMKLPPMDRGKLYLTGGGARNRFFVRGLRDRLPGIALERIDSLGIPAGLVEAAAYAVMGEACLRGESLAAPVTGLRRDAHPILGKIAQPPL